MYAEVYTKITHCVQQLCGMYNHKLSTQVLDISEVTTIPYHTMVTYIGVDPLL